MEEAQVVERSYSIRFKLPELPPSVNSLYNVIFSLKKIEIKPEVRLWKSKMKMYVPMWRPERISESEFLYFKMDVYTNLYHKNTNVRKFDVMNMEKACIDMVCEKIGIDDKFVTDCHTRKIHSVEKEWVEVEVGFIEDKL